jgi:hypothetical protein
MFGDLAKEEEETTQQMIALKKARIESDGQTARARLELEMLRERNRALKRERQHEKDALVHKKDMMELELRKLQLMHRCVIPLFLLDLIS